MYEFIPKKRSGVAPIWFILIAAIALLIGANVTFYFVKHAVRDNVTPATQPAGQSPLGGALNPYATPTPTATSTSSETTTPTTTPTASTTSTI